MTELYTTIASSILKIVTALLEIFVVAVAVPWIKNHLVPWLKDKRLYGLCERFVQAAQKKADTGVLEKSRKKEYVIALLNAKGYEVTPEIDAFIESAVVDLDLFTKEVTADIGDAFCVDDDDIPFYEGIDNEDEELPDAEQE